MLIEPGSHLYTYVITRDFGFAPNPFHGNCTLATCKPRIRKAAVIGDWILGVGGRTLKSVHRKCIFLMKISEKLSFQEYWEDHRFALKKPVRNGSDVQLVGDNIYHKDNNCKWIQEDSHHSNPDGSPNLINLKRDTGSSDHVLISNLFFYFGNQAISIDFGKIDFIRIRDYKKTDLSNSAMGRELITSIYRENRKNLNYLISEPCQFMDSHKRVDQGTGKIS